MAWPALLGKLERPHRTRPADGISSDAHAVDVDVSREQVERSVVFPKGAVKFAGNRSIDGNVRNSLQHLKRVHGRIEVDVHGISSGNARASFVLKSSGGQAADDGKSVAGYVIRERLVALRPSSWRISVRGQDEPDDWKRKSRWRDGWWC